MNWLYVQKVCRSGKNWSKGDQHLTVGIISCRFGTSTWPKGLMPPLVEVEHRQWHLLHGAVILNFLQRIFCKLIVGDKHIFEWSRQPLLTTSSLKAIAFWIISVMDEWISLCRGSFECGIMSCTSLIMALWKWSWILGCWETSIIIIAALMSLFIRALDWSSPNHAQIPKHSRGFVTR